MRGIHWIDEAIRTTNDVANESLRNYGNDLAISVNFSSIRAVSEQCLSLLSQCVYFFVPSMVALCSCRDGLPII